MRLARLKYRSHFGVYADGPTGLIYLTLSRVEPGTIVEIRDQPDGLWLIAVDEPFKRLPCRNALSYLVESISVLDLLAEASE